MKRVIKTIVLTFTVAALCSSCDKFIFGNIEVDYKDNALTRKKDAAIGRRPLQSSCCH